ncbi:hypothetical protein L1049_012121 [Liquidambar formosana]|uniref:Small auxin up regulated protein n=1 Tax=Liquidambar formosana TaxID=63359 RepID=A0AAP0RSI4_LIQFO
MAIMRANGEKKNGISTLKIVAEKLLSLATRRAFDFKEWVEFSKKAASLPKDVKGGHFAVMAIDNGNPKRFVVHLRYLNYPAFLTLLEQAAEEFGFDQEGALSIPCHWSELERILACS